MPPISYLLSIVTTQKNVEDTIAVLNTAGRGQAFYGFSNGIVHTELWIIPKGKSNSKDITNKLQTIPTIRSISVVALSNPVREQELLPVRELFTQIGWDSSSVSNDELSLFINAKLQGFYTYYIDYNSREEVPKKIQIKPIEEHPQFSPDWLVSAEHTEEEIPDRDLTIDDLETYSFVIEEEEEDFEPPPPPSLNKK
jgi:hypothetical protein